MCKTRLLNLISLLPSSVLSLPNNRLSVEDSMVVVSENYWIPSLSQSDTQKSILKQDRSDSGITRLLSLINSPQNMMKMLCENPQLFAAASPGQAPKVQNSIQLSSCSSTNSTSSYCSTSSINGFASSALIHCVWTNNIPYFIFSSDDVQGRIYAKSPYKTKSSSNKSLDDIYLFYSKNKVGTADVVGKMKVSSSLFLNSNRSKVIETEFVLFASSLEHSTEKLRPPESVMKPNALPRKVSELFRSILLSKHNPKQKLGKLNFQYEDMRKLLPWDLGDINDSDRENYDIDDCASNFELAAIVVKDHGYASTEEQIRGGWGLKFLEKVKVDLTSSSRVTSSNNRSCEECSIISDEFAGNLSVIIPAGFHGGPIARIGGPSSLTERWRSNGHCECGGWDIGCPLKVLNSNSGILKALIQMDQEEYCSSLELFIEGTKQGEPTFKLLSLTEDMHVIYFGSTLSALQSFAIAVAIIHSQLQHLNRRS